MDEIIVIIDANYVMYVNRFALSQGLSYKGKKTEIIFGFLRHINELARHFETKKFIFCFDSRSSLRKTIYPEYKANRHTNETPEDIELNKVAYQQFNEIKDIVLPKLGFKNIFHKEGYESDDIIASIVKNNQDKFIVVASDSDLFQLLDYCTLYNISKKSLTTKTLFEREYCISPDKWHLVKMIAGCSTDNVPGISGIGEKTAIKYLNGILKTGAKAKAIESMEMSDLFKRNLELIALPFDRTGIFKITFEEKFMEKDFITICENYGFESFLSQKYLQSWIKLFNMK